jgi:exodeoxyribonuclease-3
LRIITCNVNGIRAAARKGFFTWLSQQHADVVCLQEIRASTTHLSEPLFHPEGFLCYYIEAQKSGYSGVGIYTRHQPNRIIQSLDWPVMDTEARYLQVDFKNLSVISLYLPSGSSSEARQQVKFEVLDKLGEYLRGLRRRQREFILCGDWNIAHKKIDIKNWRGNQKSSGFLPEERAWMDNLFDNIGFVDAFRVVNPEPHQYTWWSQRQKARLSNAGWRIDYQIVTPGLRDKIQNAAIYKEECFSDHAPVIIDYDLTIGAD